MRNCILASILFVFSNSQLLAADYATIRKWMNGIAAIFERDVRSGLDQPFYASQLDGLDKDSVAQQISLKMATCWVEALIPLAEKHSIEPEQIFAEAEQGIVNIDLLPGQEVSRETADCARNAFSGTGIDYDD